MKVMFSLLLGALAVLPAAQADTPVLIELFASQNCKVCPQAYETLRNVNKERRDDVLILTWAVDYWDYLGDPDPFATPAAVERQAAYADRFGLRGPYTPQSVYDGDKECPATRAATVNANIRDRQAAPDLYDIEITAQGAGSFRLNGHASRPASVQLIEYLPETASSTGMVNPVVETTSLGLWTGGQVTYSYQCETACAVIVQEQGFGKVLAASPLGVAAG